MTTRRITDWDLEKAVEIYADLCRDCGLLADGEGVWLQHGSKSNGITFRLYTLKANNHLDRAPAGEDFLGWTKRDAHEQIADRNAVLRDVARAMRKA
jgi:hypothetical protein